jgi:hypothetical protein
LLGMNHFCFGSALVLLLGAGVPAWADAPPRMSDEGAGWREQDCGGDAFTYAEVVSRPSGEREGGVIVVAPDTLCADLARRAPAVPSLHIHVEPSRPRPSGRGQPQPKP